MEPTLPELLRSSRAGRVVGVVLIVVAIALVALFLFGRGESFSYGGTEAPPFSISWGSDLERVDPVPGSGDLLRLEGGSPGARLELSVEPFGTGENSRNPDERVVLEGATELAVDRGPDAEQLAYVAPGGDGSVVIGKRFVVPDPDRPGEGVRIEISEQTADPRVIEKVDEAPAGFFLNYPIQLLLEDAASVRTDEAFEKPLRSFSFSG